MYTKDKSNRITLRLNDTLYEYVTHTADSIGISPSEFLRMVITAAYSDEIEGGKRRENEQTNINNKLSD